MKILERANAYGGKRNVSFELLGTLHTGEGHVSKMGPTWIHPTDFDFYKHGQEGLESWLRDWHKEHKTGITNPKGEWFTLDRPMYPIHSSMIKKGTLKIHGGYQTIVVVVEDDKSLAAGDTTTLHKVVSVGKVTKSL